MEKILVIGPSWVGDMVMSQSLYKLLKQNHPNAHITVAAPEYCLSILSAMPEVNDAIALPFQHGKLDFFKRRSWGRALIQSHFTQAFVLPNSWKSALIPYFAKIKERTGFKGEMRHFLLNDCRRLDKKELKRMIDRFCSLGLPKEADLPAKLPYPKLVVKGEWDNAIVSQFELDFEQPILICCPGSQFGPSKQWPSRYYAQLAQAMCDENWQVWLMGSSKDRAVCDTIASSVNGNLTNFAGKTSLEDAMALIAKGKAVVSNDSGLLHIAAALGRPVLGIYGSTTPAFTPPLSSKANTVMLEDLPCRACFKRDCPLLGENHHKCMLDLTPQRVLSQLKEMIHENSTH